MKSFALSDWGAIRQRGACRSPRHSARNGAASRLLVSCSVATVDGELVVLYPCATLSCLTRIFILGDRIANKHHGARSLGEFLHAVVQTRDSPLTTNQPGNQIQRLLHKVKSQAAR